MITNYAIKLAGLPWWWIQAEMLPDYAKYLSLSKDAPYALTIARKGVHGWMMIKAVIDFTSEKLLVSDGYIEGLSFFIPKGFVRTVLSWKSSFGDRVPVGYAGDYSHEPLYYEGKSCFLLNDTGKELWVVPYPYSGLSEVNQGLVLPQ